MQNILSIPEKIDILAAFYTADKEIKNRDIVDHLRKKLLPYMVPGVFVKLDHMPLNRNRKIDRGKLLEMDISFDGSDYEEPETELEKKLCELFASVFGSKRFSVSGSFFDHGGTSLSVSRLISLMSEDGYKVSYGDAFQNPTPNDDLFFRKLIFFLGMSFLYAKNKIRCLIVCFRFRFTFWRRSCLLNYFLLLQR